MHVLAPRSPGRRRRRRRPARPRSPRDRAEAYYHFSLGLQARLRRRRRRPRSRIPQGRAGSIRAPARSGWRSRACCARRARSDEALAEAAGGGAARPRQRRRPPDPRAALPAPRARARRGRRRCAGPRRSTRRSCACSPGDGRTLLTLADLYGQLQQHEDAARAWERYLELDPGNFEALMQLGRTSSRRASPRRPRPRCRRPWSCSPAPPAPTSSLGEIYARAQQSDQAILHYRKALELEPDNVRVRLALGEVLFRARRPQEALAEAEAVLAADAKNRFALDLKGRAAARPEAVRRGRTPPRTRRWPQDPTDLKAAYLKVTIAEARRDFAAAAAAARGHPARNRGGRGPRRRAGTTTASSSSTSASPTSSSAASRTPRPPSAAPKAVGGDPDADLLGYEAEALLLAKDLRPGARRRRARPASASRTTPTSRPWRRRSSASRATWRAALAIVEKLREKAPARRARCWSRSRTSTSKAKQYPEAEAALREARELEPKDLAHAVPARRGAGAAEEARRGGGRLPRGPRRAARLRARPQLPRAT